MTERAGWEPGISQREEDEDRQWSEGMTKTPNWESDRCCERSIAHIGKWDTIFLQKRGRAKFHGWVL